jgi:hypothetical protein
MVSSIDSFLQTKWAKKNNIFSRTDFLARSASTWLSYFDKEYGLFNGKSSDKQFITMMDNLFKNLDKMA